MSRSDAYIEVTCDGKGCTYGEEVELCTTVRGGYDARDVNSILHAYGWLVDGEYDYCPICAMDVGRDV